MRRIKDFDKELDYVQMYLLLQNARDLVKHLHEAHEDFPYDAYFTGTEALLQAMNYVDDALIHRGI